MRALPVGIFGSLACISFTFPPNTLAFAALQPTTTSTLSRPKHTHHPALFTPTKRNLQQPSSSSALSLSGGGQVQNAAKKPSSSSSPTLLRKSIAEFIGTFLLIHIGCGTVCAAIYKSAQIGLWQIAAAWSIAVTIAISTTASISGAHLNPAITIALAALRSNDDDDDDSSGWSKVVPFIIAQVSGAATAAGVNFVLYRDAIAKFEAAEGIVRGAAESVKSAAAFGEYWSVPCWTTAFFAEAMGTAMLAFVVFSLTNPKNKAMEGNNSGWIPPLIGVTVGGLISVFAPLTQAGFNPARDFGPRIVTALAGWGRGVAMKGWWVYVLGPVLGALVGAFVADKVLYADDNGASTSE